MYIECHFSLSETATYAHYMYYITDIMLSRVSYTIIYHRERPQLTTYHIHTRCYFYCWQHLTFRPLLSQRLQWVGLNCSSARAATPKIAID